MTIRRTGDTSHRTHLVDIKMMSGEYATMPIVDICHGQGCINRSILLSGMGARGVSSKHVENMENAEKMENMENHAPTEMCSGSPA